MDIQINYVAVIIATAASMLIGWIWYNPKVFGKAWIKLARINPKNGNFGLSMLAALTSSLVMAMTLAGGAYIFHAFSGNSFLSDTLLTAVLVWVGFQGLRVLQRDLFNQKRKKETLIHLGNDLVTILAMGLIIGSFGV